MATLKESNFNGRNGTHFKLKLDMTYEQDTTANKTTIRLWNNFVSMDGYSGSGSANSVTAYINSAKVGTTDSIGINQTKLLGYKDIVITHNQDGTFPNTAYSASIQTGWSLGEANVSGTMTSSDIPKINRQSTWRDFTIQDLESEFVLPINKYVSSYYNVVKIQNSNGTTIVKTIDDAVDGTAITFNSTELNSIYSMDNNASSYPLILYFELKTYTDSTKSTQVGTTQTKQVSGYLVNANPTYNVAYQDTNSTTLAITNNNQQIIQNNSTLQFNITNATALKGASLSSISIEINGVTQTQSISSSTLNFNYGTLNVANNINANVVLTDSRGLTTTKQVALTILSWELPNAIITLNRKNNYYTETDIKVDANYSSLDSKNTISIKFRQKKKNEQSYSAYTTLSDNVSTTFNADNLYEWDIQVLLEDLIGSTTYNLTLGVGQPILFVDRRKRSIGIDCFPQSTNSLEVNGDIYVYDGNDRKNIYGYETLWEDANGIQPNGQSLDLNDNIYNYRFIIWIGEYGNNCFIPIIPNDSNLFGGGMQPSVSRNIFYTFGVQSYITHGGEKISVDSYCTIGHNSNGSHAVMWSPLLYKIIGVR